MIKKYLIVANWKCNPTTRQETERLLNAIQKGIGKLKNAEVIVCPPFVYCPSVNHSSLVLGAQDCHWENRGTFTGAVSPLMLKDLGCQYVIIGHSERRKYFKETDETVNKKTRAALKSNLKPIVCIGEKTRDDNEMSLVVGEQLRKALDNIPKARIKDIIITYEPVWAISKGTIGSGTPCSPDDAVKANLFIRKELTKLYSRAVADKVRVIYGGSVSSKNAADYLKEEQIDGALVGGASLIAGDFIKIIKLAENIK